MVKLLSILSLILALILFPPAVLAVISNNAVPGDSTYPIKRTFEDIIFTMASINPTTKAWFSAARSDRRFKELNVLITQGKQAGSTLNELVEQTSIAASQIAQISDQSQKIKLVEQLSASIEKYDRGLQQFTNFSEESVTPESTPPTSVVDNTSVEPNSVAQATALPQASVLPSPRSAVVSHPTIQPSARPSLASSPPPTPAPVVQPTPIQHIDEEGRDRQREIEEARRKLEEIKKKLQHESRGEIRERSEKQENEHKDSSKEDKSSESNKRGNPSQKKETP